jgi:hypothetical protein
MNKFSLTLLLVITVIFGSTAQTTLLLDADV